MEIVNHFLSFTVALKIPHSSMGTGMYSGTSWSHSESVTAYANGMLIVIAVNVACLHR